MTRQQRVDWWTEVARTVTEEEREARRQARRRRAEQAERERAYMRRLQACTSMDELERVTRAWFERGEIAP